MRLKTVLFNSPCFHISMASWFGWCEMSQFKVVAHCEGSSEGSSRYSSMARMRVCSRGTNLLVEAGLPDEGTWMRAALL